MPETTDTTRPFNLTPEGTYEFTVKELPLKKPTKNDPAKLYFQFKFAYMNQEGERKTHTEFLMPWDLPPLLLALGFEETEKNKFTWERQECIGKTVKATIQHQSNKKDPTKIMARMTNILPAITRPDDEIPF